MATNNKPHETEFVDSGIRVHLTQDEYIDFRRGPWLLSDFERLRTMPLIASDRVKFVLPFIVGWKLKNVEAQDLQFAPDMNLMSLNIEGNKAEAIVGAWYRAYYKAQELPLATN